MNGDETQFGGTKGEFTPTKWGLIFSARSGSSAEALNDLVSRYWRPVYAFIRRQGASVEDAKDLTQEFFETFVRRNAVARVDPSVGRFRTFLLAAVRNFLHDVHDRTVAQKRGAGRRPLSLEVLKSLDALGREPGGGDREWAQAILETALEDLQRVYSGLHQENRFRLFETYLRTLQEGRPPDYDALGREFELSRTDVTNYLHRARRLYRDLLRWRIAPTSSRPEEIEEEIQELFRSVRSPLP